MAEHTLASRGIDLQAQQLAFGTIVELLEIDCTKIGGQVYRIVASRPGVGAVDFLGMTFTPIPFSSEGWSWDGTGNPPRPTVTVADMDGIFLYETIKHQDLVGVQVRRWYSTAELIAQGTYRGPEIWRIIKKEAADGTSVKFALGTILDQQTVLIPARQMLQSGFPALGKNRG